MKSVQVVRRILQELTDVGLKIPQAQRANLALLTYTLAVSPNCHLAALALGLPLPGQRENLIQRLRRMLKRSADWAAGYGPLVRHLFAHWDGVEVPLVMDRTDVADRLSILTLGVAHGKRLLPLLWRVLPFGSTSAETQVSLLRQVQPWLPSVQRVRLTFFGDAEFRAVPLQAYCQQHHWHWQVGLKADIHFQQASGRSQALRDIPLQPGQRVYLQGIRLTDQHAFGPLNLIAAWSPHQDSPRYWALDQPADGQAWRRGRKRFWIEPSFRDWKSYGFDLERSQITDPQRLQVLLWGMAVATLWLIHLGEWLSATGRRPLLAAAHKRDYSLFRLGRDYLQRCQTMDWSPPVGFTVRHTRSA